MYRQELRPPTPSRAVDVCNRTCRRRRGGFLTADGRRWTQMGMSGRYFIATARLLCAGPAFPASSSVASVSSCSKKRETTGSKQRLAKPSALVGLTGGNRANREECAARVLICVHLRPSAVNGPGASTARLLWLRLRRAGTSVVKKSGPQEGRTTWFRTRPGGRPRLRLLWRSARMGSGQLRH
jgi:hypothetical protein